jgi:type IV pilus assembly protein PilA
MKARKNQSGFTLVELMIVVAIAAVMSALATFGLVKYVANSKSSEALNAVGHMARSAVAAYTMENMAGTVLNLGGQAGLSNAICATATATVPTEPSSIKGRKYQSSPAEWQAGSRSVGWQCLNFSMSSPQYYMYRYTGSGGGAVGDTFNASAHGDLNGDGELSTFSLTGEIKTDGTNKVLVTTPTMYSDEPGE